MRVIIIGGDLGILGTVPVQRVFHGRDITLLLIYKILTLLKNLKISLDCPGQQEIFFFNLL